MNFYKVFFFQKFQMTPFIVCMASRNGTITRFVLPRIQYLFYIIHLTKFLGVPLRMRHGTLYVDS